MVQFTNLVHQQNLIATRLPPNKMLIRDHPSPLSVVLFYPCTYPSHVQDSTNSDQVHFLCMTHTHTHTCTMMKPHFKGKTTSTKPMYSSRKLIHPRAYPSCIKKHSACGREKHLWHRSTGQLYYDFLYYGFLRCMGCTTLRVQYPYTLENHSTTITYIYMHT